MEKNEYKQIMFCISKLIHYLIVCRFPLPYINIFIKLISCEFLTLIHNSESYLSSCLEKK